MLTEHDAVATLCAPVEGPKEMKFNTPIIAQSKGDKTRMSLCGKAGKSAQGADYIVKPNAVLQTTL